MKASKGPVQVQTHLPERRRRAVDTLCCGCSCCCCCLHSIGGIIGAAIAPVLGSGARLPITYYYEDEIVVPDIVKPGMSAIQMFWWVLLALIGVGVVLGMITSFVNGILVALFVMVMVLPALQLVACFLTGLFLVSGSRPDRYYQLRRLIKLCLGMVAGTVIGIAVMGLIYVGMRGR